MDADLFAFLDAIAAGDNTARLVFADWLDDRDDPRGPAVRGADCGAAGRLFLRELMLRCEAQGVVAEWRRLARVLYYRDRSGPPKAYSVSWAFYHKLVDSVERHLDFVAADLRGGGPGLVFMRVPVVVRDEQPAGV